MADKVGDEFEGYITGVTAFGLFIELIEHFVEGLVHVSTMADDYYRFVERAHILRGENTGKVTGSAIASPCRSSRWTWSGARSISGWPRSSTRCGSPNGTAVRAAAGPSRSDAALTATTGTRPVGRGGQEGEAVQAATEAQAAARPPRAGDEKGAMTCDEERARNGDGADRCVPRSHARDDRPVGRCGGGVTLRQRRAPAGRGS